MPLPKFMESLGMGRVEPDAKPPAAGAQQPLDEKRDADHASGRRQGPIIDESQARRLGWVPKEEWTRDPDKWESLEDFAASLPERAIRYRQHNLSLQEQMRRTAQAAARTLEEEQTRLRQEVKARLANAIERGDQPAAYKAADDLDKVREPLPEIKAWIERNPWFTTDPLAHAVAAAKTEELARRGVGVNEQLEQAEREVKRRFPELFVSDEPLERQDQREDDRSQPGPKRPDVAERIAKRPLPRMEGGSQGRPLGRKAPGGEMGYDDIPKAARDAYQSTLAKRGVDRDAWAKAYWASRAEEGDEE